jgi:hypothetical protein
MFIFLLNRNATLKKMYNFMILRQLNQFKEIIKNLSNSLLLVHSRFYYYSNHIKTNFSWDLNMNIIEIIADLDLFQNT